MYSSHHSFFSGYASLISESTLRRIMGPPKAIEGSVSGLTLGMRIPGVVLMCSTNSSSLKALSLYERSPVILEYVAKPIIAKVSLKKYLSLLTTGLPSDVTLKNILPSLSKQCASMKSMRLLAASRYSGFFSMCSYAAQNVQSALP